MFNQTIMRIHVKTVQCHLLMIMNYDHMFGFFVLYVVECTLATLDHCFELCVWKWRHNENVTGCKKKMFGIISKIVDGDRHFYIF